MYEFYDVDGVEWVRIHVGLDCIERPATDADHAAAESGGYWTPPVEPVEEGTSTTQPTQKQIEQEFDAKLAEELANEGKGHKRGK
jgi:hypothetical protein